MHVVPKLACLFALSLPFQLSAQRAGTDTVALQRLLVAEDARGTGSDGVAPLIEGLASRDPLLRRVAARGVGRLQRPDLGLRLVPLLGDAVPAIRAEAANGIAQSLRRARRGAAPADSTQLTVAAAQRALSAALEREKDQAAAGIMARSLGRLTLPDSASARAAEAVIVAKGEWMPSYDLMHGLYRLALARRFTGTPSTAALELLRRTVKTSSDAGARRLAVLALRSAGALDASTVLIATKDRDAQVRRLALAGVPLLSTTERANVLHDAFTDGSPIVRIDAIAATRAGLERPDCTAIVAATTDPAPYVRQMAIDALGAPCLDSSAAIAALERAAKDRQWQLRAHAVVSLAKRSPGRARGYVTTLAASANPFDRVYAARALGAMSDTARLVAMAADADHNVTESAITELSRVAKRMGDSVYIRALSSKGNQVVLAAATALAGSQHERTLPALLDGFDAISAGKLENARDPRLAILKRIEEIGTAATAPRLRPYLADFDTTVAQTVAAMLTKFTGTTVAAAPKPLPIRAEPLARIFLAREVRLRVTMAPSSGGGSFTLRMFADEAPATVARYVRLARAHYFDGHVLQRVEPNFVIQGGGPDASEYVGEATFMRDEVSARPHLRGTAGVSSRGRDTGDAQLFLNLVDNPVLDHEYTVFGEVVDGIAVMDRILEGDVIARVEVVGG